MSPRISISLLPALSDERLISLASEGHEHAFETFVERYRARLLAYCRRMGLSEWRAEEVLQQALLQVWLALRRGTEVRDPKPWLYRIVHNGAVNAMRRTSEDHAVLTEAIHERAALAGEAFPQRPMAMREALDEVVALPQMQREAVLLTAIEGQTELEVAGTLGITHGAVRGLLYRARATLRGAAAVMAPEPLICWLSSGAGAGAPAAERVAELSGAGGALGMTGALLKGAVVAVSAGILVGGAAVGSLHPHGARRPHAAAQSRAAMGSAPDAGSAEPGPARRSPISSPASRVPVATGGGLDRAVANLRHLAPPPHGAPLASGPVLTPPRVPRSADPRTGPSSPDEPGSAVRSPARLVAGEGSAARGPGSPANAARPDAGRGASSSEREDPLGEPPRRSAESSRSSSEGDRRAESTEQAGAESGPVEGRDEPVQASAGDERPHAAGAGD
jgi:RNA polymerase sigma-70 factor (ECF subfamily)